MCASLTLSLCFPFLAVSADPPYPMGAISHPKYSLQRVRYLGCGWIQQIAHIAHSFSLLSFFGSVTSLIAVCKISQNIHCKGSAISGLGGIEQIVCIARSSYLLSFLALWVDPLSMGAKSPKIFTAKGALSRVPVARENCVLGSVFV